LFEGGDVVSRPDELRGFVGWEIVAYCVCRHVVMLVCVIGSLLYRCCCCCWVTSYEL
jgi:hypothetical protein